MGVAYDPNAGILKGPFPTCDCPSHHQHGPQGMKGCPVCNPRPRCDGCGQEIDPEYCHCGSPMTHSGWEGHTPVPMGCDCYRDT